MGSLKWLCLFHVAVLSHGLTNGLFLDRKATVGVIYSAGTRLCLPDGNTRSTLHTVVNSPSLDVLWREVNHSRSLITRDVCDLVEAGVQGLITVLPHTQQTMVISQAEALHLPNLVIDLRPFRSPLGKNFSVQLNPSFDINSQMVKDIFSAVGWTTATLIFDDVIDSQQRYELRQRLQRHLLHMRVFSLTTSYGNYIRVNPASPHFPRPNQHLLYLGRGDIWRKFVTQEIDLLSDGNFWMVISDVTSQEALATLKADVHANVVFVTEQWRKCIRDPWRNGEEAENKMASVSNGSTVMGKLLHDSLAFFAKAFTSYSTPLNSSQVPCRTFRPTPFPHHERLNALLADLREGHKTSMDYEIVSSSDRSGDVTIVPSGNWSVSDGLVTDKRSLFLNTFYDFGKEPILVATFPTAPFVMRVRKEGRTTYEGLCLDILNELAHLMGFNYTLIEPPDTFYGAPTGNGSWTGMIGMVQRGVRNALYKEGQLQSISLLAHAAGEAELAIGPFTIMLQREEVIDFTIPFSEGSAGILTLSPSYQADRSLFQTLKPYSMTVWVCVLCSVFLVGGVSFLVNRYTPFQGIHETRCFQAKYESSLEDNMWLAYSSVTEQGVQHCPESLSGRCLLGFWWLFTILLVATYTANLAAFLAISRPPPPINTLAELVYHDHIQPFVETESSFETVFKESTLELYKKAWSRMKEAPKISLDSEVIEMVRSGKYAMVGDKPALEFLASDSCATLTVAAESFDSVGYGFVLSQGAVYARTINRLIRQMQEAGLMEKWTTKWGRQPSHCRSSPEDKANSLGLESVGGLFLSYTGVVAVASVFLLLQIVLKYRGYRTRVECDIKTS